MRTRKNMQQTQDELKAITSKHAFLLKDDHFETYSLKKRASLIMNAMNQIKTQNSPE